MAEEPHGVDGTERLDDAAVQERLGRLDELLEQVERIPGPAGELALDAVAALAAVYGEALARAVGYLSGLPEAMAAITGDELLGHLLVLHGIHPEPVERRVARALDELRPAVRQRGGDVELAGIDQGVATVRLSGGGCGSSAAGVEEAVREAVLAVAPELSEVRREPEARRPAFVPLDTLRQRPAGVGR
jgi:Fe-S cluster biogenesis protein NfuA